MCLFCLTSSPKNSNISNLQDTRQRKRDDGGSRNDIFSFLSVDQSKVDPLLNTFADITAKLDPIFPYFCVKMISGVVNYNVTEWGWVVKS